MVYPLMWPAGELALGTRSALGDQPQVNWAWQHRGLKQGIPGDDARSPQLHYAQDHWISLSTLRQQLAQQLLQIPMMRATAALPLPLSGILKNLRGVVLGIPGEGSDCYCFNLREAVLEANLVQSPDQIFFVETAIAAWLGGQPPIAPLPPHTPLPSHTPWPSDAKHPSHTFVIHTNPATTELGVIALPLGIEEVDSAQRHLLSFAYGDMAMAQDILCQMFYGALSHPDLGVASLPVPGQPDVVIRDRLQQRLQSTLLGRSLLQMATTLHQAFRQPGALDFHIHGETRTVYPEDFNQAVLQPYLQRINSAINRVMAQANLIPSEIQQVICSGEIASQETISHWMQKKFPTASPICLPVGTTNRGTTNIATGLARLPLYPQLFRTQPHQYSNLFLTKEILTALPTRPLSLADILKTLEQRGINTVLCQNAILRLLEGHLPTGLTSAPEDVALITDGGKASVAAEPIAGFIKVDNQYQIHREAGDRLQSHLTALLTQTHQTLAEPLTLANLQE